MEKRCNLRCASCGRPDDSGPGAVATVSYQGKTWCTSCAAVRKTSAGTIYVSQPSPGQMVEDATNDPLVAWQDCYSMTPKKRILVQKAKAEVQRAWALWDGNKSTDSCMFMFYWWLWRFRPYFLTFRGKGDPWQTVHSWLLQYERENDDREAGANEALQPTARDARRG